MNGGEIALDTNQAIAVLNNTGEIATWIAAYTVAYLPVIVIGELRFGALNSARSAANLARIDQLVSRCTILGPGLATAEQYARIRLELKRQGTPIPENDIWIAAICVERNIPLATSDGHFD